MLNRAAAAAFPFPVATNAGRFSSARNSRFSPILRLNTSAFDHTMLFQNRNLSRNHKPVSLITVNGIVVKWERAFTE